MWINELTKLVHGFTKGRISIKLIHRGDVILEYLFVSIIMILTIVITIQYRRYLSIKFLLNRTNEINDRMINISEELSSFKDINNLYKQLLNETINLIQGAECGSILIFNKLNNCMDYKACVGFDEVALSKVHLKKEELFLYDTTMLKYPDIIVNPILFDENRLERHTFDDLVNTKALEIKVSLSTPLYINGDFYGVINVDSKSNMDAFSKKDIKLISYISRELEIAIKNVTLMNELVDALKIDKLTNIYNRRYFEEIMDKLLLIKNGIKRKFSVVMIDLDKFKLINDTYGHKMGDEILIYFARVLNINIRDGDMAVRYAGDEFVLFLNNIDQDGAQVVIDRVRESLLKLPYKNINIEFSAGICEYNENMNLDKILTYADDVMYIEKRNKKKIV